MGMFEWVDPTREALQKYLRGRTDFLAALPEQLASFNLADAMSRQPKPFDASGEEKMLDNALNFGPGALAGMTRAQLSKILKEPMRVSYSGIYKPASVIVAEASARTAPESPLLKQLWGVTRDDLYEMSKRQGNRPGVIPGAPAKPQGSDAADKVMTKRNEARLVDALVTAKREAPDLYRGMASWYVSDPEYQYLVKMFGEKKGGEIFSRLNEFGGIESPNLPVPVEYSRATAANMLHEQGRWDDWLKYGGLKGKESNPDVPADMVNIKGRVGHDRASKSQTKYIKTGSSGMQSPKAPLYIQASSVPELGFQTDKFVGDAHWSRAVGLADTRTNKGFAESVSTPEAVALQPWWQNISRQADLEAVPGQAVLWGVMSPQTGVKTAIGAPKLELKAIEIAKAAKRMGVSPETARDLIYAGKAHAGYADPEILKLMSAGMLGGLGGAYVGMRE